VPEANFDSIVGPTHNYAGLSPGNVASTAHRGERSQPRAAALQGLSKMQALAELGVLQGYLPPHERPHLPTLRALGFVGPDESIVERVAREAPLLLARASSASAMWAANAATVAASDDTADGRVHLSVANLQTMLHRLIEAPQTERTLRAIFADRDRFEVHAALPNSPLLGDEGAANHTRLHAEGAGPCGTPGVHLFVYGKSEGATHLPRVHPARQSLEASQAIARRHRVDPARCVFAQQSVEAIEAGVFHNDVIAVGHGPLLLHHEQAFEAPAEVLAALRSLLGARFRAVMIRRDEVPLADAVSSYLFNSQLVTAGDGRTWLVAPSESAETPSVNAAIDRLVSDPATPIDAVRFFDLRESMRNGGGPACLRLRVPLRDAEWAAIAPGCRYDPAQHARLEAWAKRHYREFLEPADLADPQLLRESRQALDELTSILGLGSIYEFQRG
jgi:succinylarginine dihydrolase